MGLLDDAKDIADRATDLAGEHSDTVTDGIDKAADFAKDKTGGSYDDQIDTGAEAAKDHVEGLDDD